YWEVEWDYIYNRSLSYKRCDFETNVYFLWRMTNQVRLYTTYFNTFIEIPCNGCWQSQIHRIRQLIDDRGWSNKSNGVWVDGYFAHYPIRRRKVDISAIDTQMSRFRHFCFNIYF